MRRTTWILGLIFGVLGPLALAGCATLSPATTPTSVARGTPVIPAATVAQPTATPAAKGVTLQYFGHSTFLLTTSAGTCLLMDPFNASVGYTVPKLDNVDIVTVGHEHADHNNVGMASGNPTIIRGLEGGNPAKIDQKVKDLRIRTVGSSHGEGRGNNGIFIFEVDGLNIVHLSDLGTTLSPEQIQQIGPVDVLMIPVGGGGFTIDAAGATTVTQQLNPKMVIPMHHKTAKNQPNWPGTGVDPFLEGKRVERPGKTTISIAKSTLPATTTVFVPNFE